MKSAVIHSTGSHLPDRVVMNEELTQFPARSLKLIAEKTGVRSRRVAPEGQCTSDLALAASRACLEKARFAADRIQAILLSTSSPDRMQPATATRVAHELGAHGAFAFDINSVCSGSTFGLCLADSLIQSGKCENVLFVAAEMYSRILNHKDFSTYPYFGDGAGAVLLRGDSSEGKGILHSCLKTDGSQRDVICVPAGGTMLPFNKMAEPGSAYFKMRGRIVFDFAVKQGTAIIRQLVQEAGVSLEEIALFVCHQANINILLTIAEKLEVSSERFFINLDRYGNTASASVLIALDEALSSRRLVEGDLVATVAFGGGLSWGANLIRI
jgi:3-oxoacyl-[acyl-carrier-protein] synthase III